MRVFGSLLSLAVMLGFFGAGTAQEKKDPTNKEKIIAVWEFVKGEKIQAVGLQPGDTIEFTKDGKMMRKYKEEGNKLTEAGTYTIDGEKINITGPRQKGVSQVLTIKTLTDKELVVELKGNDITATGWFKKK